MANSLKFTRTKEDGTFVLSITEKQSQRQTAGHVYGVCTKNIDFIGKRNYHQYGFNSFFLKEDK